MVQSEALLRRALQNTDLMAKRNVFQLQGGATFQQRREHLEHNEEAVQCRPKRFTECVQPSSSQAVRYLREAQVVKGEAVGQALFVDELFGLAAKQPISSQA